MPLRPALRLPQVLALMGLILLAGVLSVRHLEGRVGATTVPGAIVLDAPGFGPEQGAGLLRRWVLARPLWIEAGPEAGAPFGDDLARRRVAHGAAVVHIDLSRSTSRLGTGLPGGGRPAGHPPGADDGPAGADAAPGPSTEAPLEPARELESERPRQLPRDAWPVQLDPTIGPDGRPVAAPFGPALAALAELLDGPIGVRPFLAVVQGGSDTTVEEVDAYLAHLTEAAARLPSYRATAIIVLGRDEPEAGRRYALRLDVGRERPLRVGSPLSDLLEDAW